MYFSTSKIFLFLSLFIFSCAENSSKKREEKRTSPKLKVSQSNKPKNTIVRHKDTLNAKNAETFFAEYGKIHQETKILIATNFGAITLRLFDDTPMHRASFIFLIKNNYFDTTVFYRVSKDFVIQGGNSDDDFTVEQRRKFDNYLLKPEFRPNRKHVYGALSAAKDWDNNPKNLSSPFEFFIVQKKSGAHHLDHKHTVFGEVLSGFDTIDKINNVATGSDEWPVTDVGMTITILE